MEVGRDNRELLCKVLTRVTTVACWALAAAFMLTAAAAAEPEENEAGKGPEMTIRFKKTPEVVKIGKEYEIVMELVNNGPDSYVSDDAISGLHIEVENAMPKNILAYTSSGDVGESDITWEDGLRWFEVIFSRLSSGQAGTVRFNIIPRKLPVRIFYRGWIPATATGQGADSEKLTLMPAYRSQSGWRDEGSIRRSPTNNDTRAPFCKALVYSGHSELQDYRCHVRGFDSTLKSAEEFTGKYDYIIEAQYSTLNRLGDDDIRYLFKLARNTIEKKISGEELVRPLEFPPILSTYYNTVYVTLYKDGEVMGCQGGTGDLVDATMAASSNLFIDRRLKLPQENSLEWFKGTTVVIDILSKKRPVISMELEGIQNEIQLGLDGIELRQGRRMAYFKSTVPITFQAGHYDLLNMLSAKAGLKQDAWQEKRTAIYKNRSVVFVEADNRRGFNRLIRATPFVEMKDVSRQRIRKAISDGLEWLARNQEDDGSFMYHYFPSRNDAGPSQSLVRQAGTAYATAMLGHSTGSSKANQAAEKAIQYLLTTIKFLNGNENLPFIQLNNDESLGGNALLLLAMVHSSQNVKYKGIMKKLVSSIIYKQNDNGSFNTRYTVANTDSGQDYYPGESLLALTDYYTFVEQDARILPVMNKAFDYYSSYWRNNKNYAFISWQSQAWSRYYLVTEERKYADFVFEMQDWLLSERDMQHDLNDAYFIDYWGGFKDYHPPGYTTGVYLEGLVEAYRIARKLGDALRMEKYGKALTAGARFALSQQFTDENMHYIKDRSRTLGGFRTSLIDNSLRCDITQHYMIALNKVLDNLNDRDFKDYAY